MLKSSYIYKNSLIHKLNSILKIIDILIIMLSILCINKITDMIILSIYLLIIILLTKINIINYLKKVFKLKILILFIIIINLLLKSNPINIIYLVVKVILLVINSSILMFTTKEKDITYSLEILLSPLKKILPIKEMALSISLSLIFIPLVIEESKNIIDATWFSIDDLTFFVAENEKGQPWLKIYKDKLMIAARYAIEDKEEK